MINTLATRTRIGPMIVTTTNLKVVTSYFSATALSRGRQESKLSSPYQPSKPNTSLFPKAPMKQIGYTSSTEIYTAKMHLRSRYIATIQPHLVISQLGPWSSYNAYQRLLSQLSRSPCVQHSWLLLPAHERQCGRHTNQGLDEGSAQDIHKADGATVRSIEGLI